MYQLLFHLLVLTLFIGLINKCVGDGKCQHTCVGNGFCRSKWFSGTCYYLYKDRRRNWYESHQFCAAQKLSMVKFTKEMIDDQFSVNDLFPMENGIWLGGREIDLGKWVFLNNTVANKTVLRSPVALETPEQHAYCAYLHFYNHNIEVGLDVCSQKQFSLCRNAHCEGNVSCLELHERDENWFEGRSSCIDLGGDLFYLKDNETLISAGLTVNNEIYKRIREFSLYVHIGLRQQRLEWTDGTEILYTKWAENGPDNLQEKCVSMDAETEQWHDDDCYDVKLVFCQRASDSYNVSANGHVTKSSSNNELGSLTPPSGAPMRNAQLTTYPSEVIILAVLFGLALPTTAFLAVCLIRKHFKKTKLTDERIDEASGYEIPVMNDYVNDGMAININCASLAAP